MTVKKKPEENTCPNCGYCPHCGRSNAPIIVQPWYPYPYYPQHPWWYASGGNYSDTITVTQDSGSAITSQSSQFIG